MDIEKLEKLGCLKLDFEQQEKMKKSIDAIMDMMHAIDNVDDVESLENEEIKCNLKEDIINDKYLIDKELGKKSLHLEDGVFLAPKTIRKD